jgi:hypothetical protein
MRHGIKNGFNKMSISKLMSKGLATLYQDLTGFKNAAGHAFDGGLRAIAARDEKKETLIATLHQLGAYVTYVANSNEVILTSSGFDVKRQRQAAQPISHVDTPKIKGGKSAGELMVKIPRVKSAYGYLFCISTDESLPASQWTWFFSSRTKHLLQQLNSGTRYYIKVAALGKNEQCVFSATSSYIPQ